MNTSIFVMHFPSTVDNLLSLLHHFLANVRHCCERISNVFTRNTVALR